MEGGIAWNYKNNSRRQTSRSFKNMLMSDYDKARVCLAGGNKDRLDQKWVVIDPDLVFGEPLPCCKETFSGSEKKFKHLPRRFNRNIETFLVSELQVAQNATDKSLDY